MKKDNKNSAFSPKIFWTRVLAIVLALLMVGSVATIVLSLIFAAK